MPTAQLTDNQFEALLAGYRHLHANPEVAHAEFATTDWLVDRMTQLGFEIHRPSPTGLAAVLTNGAGPVVGFRADIDGLRVTEQTGVAWAATNGAMHACGHDIHMVCALGAAEFFATNRDQWAGTLEIIFQPAEEVVEGARTMIEAGLWDAIPHAEVIFGQHVWPSVAGEIQLAPGAFFSTVDSYRIVVHGRGGHGSMPELTVDPVVLCAAITLRLQTIISREIGLHESAVLTVGAIRVGSAENVIPESGELLVSTRSYDEAIRQRMADAIVRIARAEALASGAPEPTIEPRYRAASLHNDPDATAALQEVFVQAFGTEQVITPEHPMTAAEDFGYLGAAIGAPSVYWVIGGFTPERIAADEPLPTNHSPKFLPDPEASIRAGTAAAIAALTSRLGR